MKRIADFSLEAERRVREAIRIRSWPNNVDDYELSIAAIERCLPDGSRCLLVKGVRSRNIMESRGGRDEVAVGTAKETRDWRLPIEVITHPLGLADERLRQIKRWEAILKQNEEVARLQNYLDRVVLREEEIAKITAHLEVLRGGVGKGGVSAGEGEEFDRKFYDYCNAELVESLRHVAGRFASLMRDGDGEGDANER